MAETAPALDRIASPVTLHITTREVLVEVVASDRHGHPVRDLGRDEFQILEVDKGSKKSPQAILAVNVIDPVTAVSTAPSAGFRIAVGGRCAVATTFHYQIVFPANRRGGYHEILVKTTRPQVALSYRHRYYVGYSVEETVSGHPRSQPYSPATADTLLREAACYHSTTPSSIALSARLVATGSTTSARYALSIRSESLGFIAISDEAQRVDLDYGICTFDASGMPLQFMRASTERVLTTVEFERAMIHGLPNLLDLPDTGTPAYARFVVRDRATGNLGSVDVANPLATPEEPAEHGRVAPPAGSIRAFGSVVPAANTFCGDVYELPETTRDLPQFGSLDPIGSVYVNALNVPDQEILDKTGIPGVTTRVAWFGVDYHATFWVAEPGEYTFRLTSDDGARLYVDDVQVLALDGVHAADVATGHIALTVGTHLVHVPYFKGPPDRLALVLEVAPPGGKLRVFDLGAYTSGLESIV